MIRSFLILLLLAVSFALPSGNVLAGDKPLITVRFDNNAVAYEQALDKAVKLALHEKPDVFFDIVATSTKVNNRKDSKRIEDIIKLRAGEVAGHLKQAGVAEDMIRTTFLTGLVSQAPEIKIFVQ